MTPKLKPLSDQVMVVTGASSGIGLATVRAAAAQGAKVVMSARSAVTLNALAAEMNKQGEKAFAFACDVTDRAELDRLAAAAKERFGRIDTWVNNAGIGLYGMLEQVSEDDSRRLFDINFWGVVNGSLAALPYLKLQGGALINVGSEVSEAVVPLLGMYSATKHAVKGFTDALRLEVEEVGDLPVSITLVQPTAVDTPFPHHARNYMEFEPKLPGPMIEADQVARAILDAAVKPERDIRVGGKAVLSTMMSKLMPSLADQVAAKQVDKQQYAEPPRRLMGILYEPSEVAGTAGRIRGIAGPKPSS